MGTRGAGGEDYCFPATRRNNTGWAFVDHRVPNGYDVGGQSPSRERNFVMAISTARHPQHRPAGREYDRRHFLEAAVLIPAALAAAQPLRGGPRQPSKACGGHSHAAHPLGQALGFAAGPWRA